MHDLKPLHLIVLSFRVSELRQSIRKLVDIARVLREQRNKQGRREREGKEKRVFIVCRCFGTRGS